MAESVLSKLVGTDKETKERLVSIDNTLQKMLLNDQKMAKNEDKRYKREQQSSKRRSGDKTLTSKILGGKGKDKKEKKGFLDGLLGAIIGPLGALIGGIGIPTILGALGITALGATIAGYFTSKKFKDFLDKNVGVPLGRALERGTRDLLKNTPLAFTPDQDKTNKNIPLTGLNTKGTKNLLEGVVKSLAEDKDATEEQRNVSERLLENITTIEKKRKVINELEKQRDKFQRDIDQAQDYITKTKQDAKDNDRELTGMEKAAIKSYEAGIKEYKKDRDARSTNIKINEDQIKSLLTIEANGKKNNELMLKLINQTRERQSKELGESYVPLTLDNFKQSGGPITVPGHSTGDKHPALLPPGSFVLNRNASGYQNGGIPAMLESGEKVFGPGQWGPREMMMNSAIPRFQEGGEVDPTRKPKEGEISRSALGSLIFKNGKWVDYKESDKVKKKSEPTLSQRRTSSVLDGWGAPEPKEPVKDTTKEPTIKEGKDKNNGEGGASAVIAAGKQLLKEGFTVAEHPNFDKQRGFRPEGDARVGGHSPGSLHYSNLALDVTDWRSGDWLGRTKGLAENVYQKKDDMKLTQIIHDPWGSWFGGGKEGGIGGHGTHLHLGFASGPGGDTGSLSGNGPNGGGGGISSGILDTLMGIAGPVGEFLKGAIGVLGDVFGGSDFVSMLFGSLGGGGSDVPTGDITASSDPLTGDTQAKAKEMYEYIKDKGYSDAQAKGIVVNIQRESNFDAGAASGDDGGAGGLFQWKGSRQTPTVQGLVKNKNWKGQIDYALQEDVGPQYKSATSGMSAHEASDWWMKKWERPADPVAGSAKHAAMLKGLGFQSGGVINMKGSSGGPNISQKSENQFIDKLTSAMSPVVVPMPVGGGGGGGGSTSSGQTNSSIPALSAYPNNSVALDLAYRLSMGASFS